MRRTSQVLILLLAVLALAAVGCGRGGGGNDPTVTGDVGAEQNGDAGGAGDTANGDSADSDGDTGGGDSAGVEMLTGQFEPLKENTDRDISGKATLTRAQAGTTLSVVVNGLQPNASHPAHLHDGTCAERGPHYQNDPEGPEEPPNELWPSSDPLEPKAGLKTNAEGKTTGTTTVEWQVDDGPLSVFVHSPASGHEKIACADLGSFS